MPTPPWFNPRALLPAVPAVGTGVMRPPVAVAIALVAAALIMALAQLVLPLIKTKPGGLFVDDLIQARRERRAAKAKRRAANARRRVAKARRQARQAQQRAEPAGSPPRPPAPPADA